MIVFLKKKKIGKLHTHKKSDAAMEEDFMLLSKLDKFELYFVAFTCNVKFKQNLFGF